MFYYFELFFVWGALPGSAGCFKKATETPNAGHPIWRELLGRNYASVKKNTVSQNVEGV
jgi:hypothetical protein